MKNTQYLCVAGSDLVEWLFSHVEGFADRRDARKYACNLLKAGFIRHTVNKITFSEQCYYVFGDLSGGRLFLTHLSLFVFSAFIFQSYFNFLLILFIYVWFRILF